MTEDEIYEQLKKPNVSGADTMFLVESIRSAFPDISIGEARNVTGRLNADIVFAMAVEKTTLEDNLDRYNISGNVLKKLQAKINILEAANGISPRGDGTAFMPNSLLYTYPELSNEEAEEAADRYNTELMKKQISYNIRKGDNIKAGVVVEEALERFPSKSSDIITEYFKNDVIEKYTGDISPEEFLLEINNKLYSNAYGLPGWFFLMKLSVKDYLTSDVLLSIKPDLEAKFAIKRYESSFDSTSKKLSLEECKEDYPNYSSETINRIVDRFNLHIAIDEMRQLIKYIGKIKITDQDVERRYPDLSKESVVELADRINDDSHFKPKVNTIPNRFRISEYDLDESNRENPKIKELTVDMIKKLMPDGMPKGLEKISLLLKNASELSVAEAESLREMQKNGTEISIQILETNLIPVQRDPYTVDEYIMCRQEIDEVIDKARICIDENEKSQLPIFERICEILSKKMKYNHEAVKKGHELIAELESAEKNLNKFGKMSNEVDYQKEYDIARENYEKNDFRTPRNMIGGLLQGECVCAGYAEILRNVLACAGIDAINVGGFSHDGAAHQWNQVKIDGKWYNTDLCWMRDEIVKGKKVQLLQNDFDFNIKASSEAMPDDVEFNTVDSLKMMLKLTHGEYIRNFDFQDGEYSCDSKSIEYTPHNKIKLLIKEELGSFKKGKIKNNVKEFVNDAASKINYSLVKEISDKIIGRVKSQHNKSKGDMSYDR